MIIRSFFKIIIDSLFPISNADKLLFSYTKEQAFEKLSKCSETPIQNTYSVFSYKNDLVTRLVWNIKYKKDMRAVSIGGYALWRKINEITNNQIPITNYPSFASFYAKATKDKKATEGKQILLIPIPISQKRRNERGFNQCELLVDEIIRLDGTNGRFITSKDLLIRTVHKDRQTLKGREERLEDAKNIFSVNIEMLDSFGKDIPVIIIDDVITTGSTMKEAMETLGLAGFGSVIGISLAH